MAIVIQDLLDKDIFERFTVVAGSQALNRPFESVSILETPDFENYIVEKALILTTFYPIQQDVSLMEKLLKTLATRATAGLIVKTHRYITALPENITALAESLSLPIITLDYDANLSILFNNILAEIQVRDYSTFAMDESYADLLQEVYENPTTKTLIETVKKIPDLDILIQNLENKTTYYTSDQIKDSYERLKQTKNLIQRLDNMLYYSEDVIYDDHAIYRMVFLAKNDRRHIIHNTVKIFKLMIVVIYQKKLENALRQNEFLLNFVSNLAPNYSNEQFKQAAQRYAWRVDFPVVLLLFSLKNKEKEAVSPHLIEYTRTVILHKFHLHAQEIRYTYLNNQLLFIVNTQPSLTMHAVVDTVYQTVQNKFPSLNIKVGYSNRVDQANEIAKTYFRLSEAMAHMETKALNISILSENQIHLLNLLKNIDFNSIKTYAQARLEPLLAYEKKNAVPLITTLHTYIESNFNAALTAQKLYIHYNTLRHRLTLLKDLGYDFTKPQPFFDLYFALHLHRHILQT